MSEILDPQTIRRNILRREALTTLKVLSPFLAILAIIAYYYEFVLHAVQANIAINGLIIAAAAFGIILIVMRLIGAQLDMAAIERFGREAAQGVYMRTMLDEPWLKKRYVRHYLGHIALTGGTLSSALDQNAIESELHALSSDYEHKLELPQFIVGFMIAMGLLGTFIGLLETLTGISGMLDGFGGTGADMDKQFMKLVGELKKPLAGMGIAFSASMFGLVTSLMLAIMMINLRRYVSHVVACARSVMHELTELTRGGSTSSGVAQLTPEDIARMAKGEMPGRAVSAPSISDGELSLQDLMHQSHDTSMMMAGRIDSLTRRLESLAQMFENHIQSSQKMNDLLGFGPRMKETSEKMLEELKGVTSGQVEQNKFAQRYIDTGIETSRILGSVIQVQREGYTGTVQSLKELGDRLARLEEGNAQIGNHFRDLLQASREARSEHTSSLRELGDKLLRIEESNNSSGRHLWEIKETFTKVGAYSGVAESISTGVGQQIILLETLIKEDRNLQKRLTSIQQDIRERSLSTDEQTATDLPKFEV